MGIPLRRLKEDLCKLLLLWVHLKLILWKNLLIIRKRHWFLTTTEILIPILLFTLMAFGRSKISGMKKEHIREPTYYDISDTYDMFAHLNVDKLNLWYSPYNDFTEEIINRVQEKLQIKEDAVTVFADKEEILSRFEKNSSSLIAAVIFDAGESGTHLKYDLTIYEKYFSWNTDRLFIPFLEAEESKSSKYVSKGYAALQLALDMSYIELHHNGNNKVDIEFTLQEFPEPPRTIDAGLNQLFMYFLPLITIFSFIFLCPAVLQRVGEEKASGTKEFMKMVGLKSSLIWFGWFVHALITNLFSIIAIVILMKVPLWNVSYPPIEFADGTVLFVFLFLYCMAAITLCFLIASIIDSPSIATIVGILVWIISYFVPQIYVNSHENLLWKFKIPFAIFPNMALSYGYSSISVYEIRETGVQWSNIFEPGSGDDNDVTMGNVFLMLIFDMVIFMLLTLYIENIKPGQYGIAKSYNYPLTSLKKWVKNYLKKDGIEENSDPLMENQKIKIINLRKKFSNYVAVDNLNMTVLENEITVLLGQNGAGKTTTMSILTGMINASGGDILINGKSIKEDADEVRQLIGLCPQHNLLFPDLTVLEHLKFFAKLKGFEAADKDIDELLENFDMYDKKNHMTHTLSGGMKRKLCLGMALIGHSEILVLDEPTSGMDPESRRKIWNLLKNYKNSKTILISTHFMEEADVLADKIAIMANGTLQCYGTPMELKAQYNTGYHLSVSVDSTNCVKEITNEVKQHFKEAKVIRENGKSVVYLLPFGGNFEKLIEELEQKQDEGLIKNISMNLTTLTDVFLKAKDEADNARQHVTIDINQSNESKKDDNKILSIKKRPLNNFYALFRKRFYFLKRKYFWFIPAILVTAVTFILSFKLAMSNNNNNFGSGPSISYNLKIYGTPKVFYGENNLADPLVANMATLYGKILQEENCYGAFAKNVSTEIIKEGMANIAFYRQHMIAAAEFNRSDTNKVIVNAMYSTNSLHGLPISINLVTNTVLKTLLGETYSISITNTPLKSLSSQFAPSELSLIHVASIWSILIPISMFFFMSNFIIFPYTEISTNFLKIQTFAGIKTLFYWLTNIVFDVMFAVIPLILLFSLLCFLNWLQYNSEAFKSTDIVTIVAIIVTYVFASLPFTYLLSYRKTITEGFTFLFWFGVFTGIIPAMVIVAMEFSTEAFYEQLAKYLTPLLLIINPHFALSYISIKFSRKYVENFNWKYMDPQKKRHICNTEPTPCCNHGDNYYSDLVSETTCSKYQNYFQNEKLGIQSDLLILIFGGFVLYFIILLIWNKENFQENFQRILYFIKHFSNKEENSIEDKDKDNALCVQNLTKSIGSKNIVKNLTLKLKRNKCFGLLGVNGAGKTTTFRMLTKYLVYNKGDITLRSKDKGTIKITQPEYCEKIGYCPQEDWLNFSLTGRELLHTIACFKGYSLSDAEIITNDLLRSFDFDEYADKPCSEYSGGNKRKLSTSIAFLGNPEIVMLDEPTSGVDPASRRKFWTKLSSFKEKSSFLLCSHSMEESENLCDELAIMKAGEIQDRGSLSELKHKHQRGFKIKIKLNNSTDEEIEYAKTYITKHFKAKITEEYAETLTFETENNTEKLSGLLRELNNMKNCLGVVDYAINEISLEDIFLKVAEDPKTTLSIVKTKKPSGEMDR